MIVLIPDDHNHELSYPQFEQALGVGEGQGSPACCSPWGRKELDTNERLNNDKWDRHVHTAIFKKDNQQGTTE